MTNKVKHGADCFETEKLNVGMFGMPFWVSQMQKFPFRRGDCGHHKKCFWLYYADLRKAITNACSSVSAEISDYTTCLEMGILDQ